MNKTQVLAACISVLGLAAGSAIAAEEKEGPTHCSLETLHGTMAWAAVSTDNGTQWSGSGQESYDGKGHFKYYEFRSYSFQTYTFSGSGTYTITANCIATVTYEGVPKPWVYYVSADGEHYYWNNNQDAGMISAGRADRVSKALLVP